MSRTDKDRPYWVRANDPYEAREAYHDCGRELRGIVGYGMRTISRFMDVDYGKGWVYTYEDGIYSRHWGRIIRREFVEVEEYGPIYGYLPPKACDLDAFSRTEEEWDSKTCSYGVVDFPSWTTNPSTWEHYYGTEVRRRRVRDDLHEAVKWHRADPEEFAEDFDLNYTEPRIPYYW